MPLIQEMREFLAGYSDNWEIIDYLGTRMLKYIFGHPSTLAEEVEGETDLDRLISYRRIENLDVDGCIYLRKNYQRTSITLATTVEVLMSGAKECFLSTDDNSFPVEGVSEVIRSTLKDHLVRVYPANHLYTRELDELIRCRFEQYAMNNTKTRKEQSLRKTDFISLIKGIQECKITTFEMKMVDDYPLVKQTYNKIKAYCGDDEKAATSLMSSTSETSPVYLSKEDTLKVFEWYWSDYSEYILTLARDTPLKYFTTKKQEIRNNLLNFYICIVLTLFILKWLLF